MIDNLSELVLGALLNLAVALIIVRGIYYPVTKEKSYVITFLAFNTVIYFMLSMLTSAELTVAAGFGLFAIFSVLRYRTDEMPIREMTYLFVTIALPVVNSLLTPDTHLPTLAFVNLSVIVLMFALEKGWGFRFSASQKVVYERIELITPQRLPELIEDLRLRTGLPVTYVRVGTIDFLHDTAMLTIYYDDKDVLAHS